MNFAHKVNSIRQLELALGDPRSPGSALSFARSLDLDERESLPEAEYGALRKTRLQDYFVPRHLGGCLDDLDGFVLALRTVFRRDPAIGLGFGMTSFMAALPVWQSGTQEQKLALADTLLQGKAVAVAFHEPAHGNDILACSFEARRDGDTFVLNGQKNLINNIARADAALLFARTGSAPGPRNHSLLLLNHQDLAGGTTLPRLRTLGVRACDLRGWSACEVRVPGSALVGREGRAYDNVAQAFQVSRAIIPGIVVGIVDSAWRLCFGFLRDRTLYGGSALALPLVRRDLGSVFSDILAADAFSLAVARMAQALPDQLCLASAVVKAFVPSRLAGVMKRLSVLLGARHYLREGENAFFQKLARDLPVLLLGHASSDVCLSLVAFQMRQMAHLNAVSDIAHTCSTAEWGQLEATFRLSMPLPDLDQERLVLSCRGRDLVMEALPELLGLHPLEGTLAEGMRRLVVQVIEQRKDLLKITREQLLALPPEHPAWFAAAERYSRLYSAACVLFSWYHNRADLMRDGSQGMGSRADAPQTYDQLFLRALEQALGVETKSTEWIQTAMDEMHCCADKGFSIGLLRISHAGAATVVETDFSSTAR